MSGHEKGPEPVGTSLARALDRLGNTISERNRKQIEAEARPGESYDQAEARLRQEANRKEKPQGNQGGGKPAARVAVAGGPSDKRPKKGRAFKKAPPLAEDRQVQGDLFVANILDVTPKGDMASMEHPVFALRPGDKRIRSYEHNGNTLEVIPSGQGLATMHDKDVLLYCIGQIVEGRNRGRDPSRTVRVTAFDLLTVTNRGTGKDHYERLKAALNRLRGTTLNTTIRTGGKPVDEGFGLIDNWRIEREDESGRMVAIDITVSEWTYNAILAFEVLTYNRDYFRLRGGLERRLYELARKHCGLKQPKWPVGLELLKKKAGSGGPLKTFRQDIKQIAHSDHLPDYRIHYDDASDQVVFYLRSEAGHREQLADLFRSVTEAKDTKAKGKNR